MKRLVARLSITLDDVSPTVRRTIDVPLELKLDRLHSVIQEAFLWSDTHLWEFTFGRTGFGIPDAAYGIGSPRDARRSTLGETLRLLRGNSFSYVYDFGDAWHHSVTIVEILHAQTGTTYPALLEAIGSRPPEDCGGAHVYAEKLVALADTSHEDHEDAIEALGYDYDPNRPASIEMINSGFAALRKRWSRRTAKSEKP